MKNPKPTRGRGRPQHRVTSELMKALIGVQDQLARRRARQLVTLQQQYVLVADVQRERQESLAVIDAHLCRAIAEVTPRIVEAAPVEAERYRLLDVVLRGALNAAADELEAMAEAVPSTAPRPPRLPASKSLPAARARAARMKVALAEFREAIAS